jgi:predicted DNA-binding protein (UPF0251 family)
LRRYALALTGDRTTGDWYVRVALETLLEEPSRIAPDGDVKFQLYELLCDVLAIGGPASSFPAARFDQDRHGVALNLRDRVLALPLTTRHLLLLVTLEGFALEQAARMMKIPRAEAASRLRSAREHCSPATDRGARAVARAGRRGRPGFGHSYAQSVAQMGAI